MPEKFLSPGEVATYLDVSTRNVLSLLKLGRLGGIRVNARVVRIPLSEVEAFVRSQLVLSGAQRSLHKRDTAEQTADK
jgi:excisionase family DNA binding protein